MRGDDAKQRRTRLVAAFDGGVMTSDAGALLLRETDRAIGLIERVARCFEDGRAGDRVVHTVADLGDQGLRGYTEKKGFAYKPLTSKPFTAA